MDKKNRPLLTHFALRAKDIDASAAFYKKYVGLDLISQRKEHTTRVAWLGNPKVHEQFIIVLLEMDHDAQESTSFHHIGIDLCSREKVDEIANQAREEGILELEPDDHGPVAGYLCIVKDPDGNQVEFSSGQEVFEALNHKKQNKKTNKLKNIFFSSIQSSFFSIFLILLFSVLFYGMNLQTQPGPTGDSIKFQYIGSIGGIPHQTGYPVYLGLNALFSWLPYSTLAFRANLLSLMFAVGTLVFLFLTCKQLSQNKLIALLTTFVVGMTPVFFSYSVIAEVYSMHTFIISALIYCLVVWNQKHNTLWLWLLTLCITLGFLHHMLILFIIPGVMLLLAGQYRYLPHPITLILMALVGIIIIFSVYMFFYFYATSSERYMDWYFHDLETYWQFLTGAQSSRGWLSQLSGASILNGYQELFIELGQNWGYLLLIIGIAALIENIIFGRWLGWMFSLSFLLWSFFNATYNVADKYQYYVHGVLLLAVLINFSFHRMTQIHQFELVRSRDVTLSLVIVLVFVFSSLTEDKDKYVSNQYGLNYEQFPKILNELSNDIYLMPKWYMHEQLFRYYSVNNDNQRILSPYIKPQKLIAYFEEDEPFIDRGRPVEPDQQIYTFDMHKNFIPFGFRFDRKKTLAQTDFFLYELRFFPELKEAN